MTLEELQEVRAEHSIPYHILDSVMIAYASNWFESQRRFVEWDKLEECYQGIFNGSSLEEAVGELMYGIADDCGDLDLIPEYIKPNIDWECVGRDAVFNGLYWGARTMGFYFAIFRTL